MHRSEMPLRDKSNEQEQPPWTSLIRHIDFLRDVLMLCERKQQQQQQQHCVVSLALASFKYV
jgi:hypothetical protein